LVTVNAASRSASATYASVPPKTRAERRARKPAARDSPEATITAATIHAVLGETGLR
jgi:hypothetical protein